MRLIDADALRQKIEEWMNNANKGSLFSDSVESFAYDEVLDAIDVAPTIKPKTPWISVNDALPKDNEFVFVYASDNDNFTDAMYTGKGRFEYCDNDWWGDEVEGVTHWMPQTAPED